MLKSRLIFFGRLAVAVIVLFLISRTIRLPALVAALATAKLGHLLIAAALVAPNLLVQLAKWRYLLQLANRKISWQTACRSLLVGFPLAFVTPGRLGEIGRALFVRELSQTRTFALVVVDKITNLLVALLAGLLGLVTFRALSLSAPLLAALAAALAILASIVIWSLLSQQATRACRRFTRTDHFGRKHLCAVYGFSAVFYVVYLTQFAFLILGFANVHLVELVNAEASVFLVKTVLPIAFGDLGIREGASVFFMQKIDVAAAAAFNAALLLYLLNVAFPSLLGLPILMKTKRAR